MAEVYEAFVSLVPSARGFGAATDKAVGPDLEASGKRGGRRWGLAFAAGASALAVVAGKVFFSSLGKASDAQQSLGATEAVFGKFADRVIKTSDNAANRFGLSANSYRENANLIGSLFKNQGVKTDQLAKKTKDFVAIGSDLAATFGGTTTSAVEALGSAFKGEFDPLERYGISLKQSTINTEAYRVANVKTATDFGKLTVAQQTAAKQQAATNLILKQSKSAAGSFGKESDTLAGQQQRLSAKMENLGAKVGGIFIPLFTRAATVANKLFDRFEPQLDRVIPQVDTFIASFGKADFTKVGDFLSNAGTKIGELVSGLSKGDTSGFASDFSQIGAALQEAAPQLKDAAKQLPSLTDALSVGSTVIGFFADHIGTLAKFLPLIVGAVIAFKVAQAAANLVTLLAVPLRIAEITTIRAHTAALRANTIQTGGSTAATSASSFALVRNRVATLAGTAAALIASGAAKAWAATQWLLNAALTANPIGLLIVGLVAVAGALFLAYKKSETFRAIVNKVFSAIRNVVVGAISFVVGFVKNNWKKIPLLLLGPLGIALALIIGNWDKIQTATSNAWGKVRDAVSKAIGKVVGFVKDIPGKVTGALGNLGDLLLNSGRELIDGLFKGIQEKWDALKHKITDIAGFISDHFPGSPVKRGPLMSFNNGGAGQRLVEMLADGLGQTSPIDDAVNNLARRVAVNPSRFSGDNLGTAGNGGAPLVHVENMYTRDETEAANELYRKQLKALSLARAS